MKAEPAKVQQSLAASMAKVIDVDSPSPLVGDNSEPRDDIPDAQPSPFGAAAVQPSSTHDELRSPAAAAQPSSALDERPSPAAAQPSPTPSIPASWGPWLDQAASTGAGDMDSRVEQVENQLKESLTAGVQDGSLPPAADQAERCDNDDDAGAGEREILFKQAWAN